MSDSASGPRPIVKLLRVVVSLSLFVGLLAAGYAGMRVLASLKKPPARGGEALPRLIVEVQPLSRTDYVEWLLGYGTARAVRESTVVAEVQGLVKWLSPKLEPGQYVEAGEELVRLDDRDYRQQEMSTLARLAQAKAALRRIETVIEGLKENLAAARAELQAAERQTERLRRAVEQGAASASDLDAQLIALKARQRTVIGLESQLRSALPDLEQARAEVDAVEATLAQVRNNLVRTVIRAPYSGFIVERRAQIGVFVAPGTPLFRIVDRSRVEIPISLPASRYGHVQRGASVEVMLEDDGPVIWRGVVARISPDIDAASRMFRVYLDVTGNGAEAPIAPGAFVAARIQGRVFRDVFVLPRVAFMGERVFVVKPDADTPDVAVVEERTPKVVAMLPDVVLVNDGLAEGEELVITNVDQVGHGTRVRVYRRDQTTASDDLRPEDLLAPAEAADTSGQAAGTD